MLRARLQKDRLEAGCDEVGRGCLAGPVVAAAVILPTEFQHPDLNDSKQVSDRKRNQLVTIIKDAAISWSVSFVDPAIIDRNNILRASFMAMERAVKRLGQTPEHLLIDGNRFRSNLDIEYTCIIKGDSKNASIAAASILAKVYRDEYMRTIHQEHPHYQWERNVGYPTKAHRAAIRAHGPTKYHRQSFRLLPDQLSLPFAH